MKDLAKEYALARLQGRLSGNEISFCENKVFTEGDIETAFNAGRESVVESVVKSMSELKWREVCYLGRDFIAAYPYGCHYVIEFIGRKLDLLCNRQFIARLTSLSHAKQAANEDYKQRIKKALGYDK